MVAAVRIVAILQTYNEQRFIGGCLDHLAKHGISAYLIDNESTDETLAIAESRLADNLIGIESLPRDGNYELTRQLVRKEELAQSLDADWLIHLDADERRVPAEPGRSLSEAIAEVDEAGFNAVNFLEFAFVPTREAPDHDHPDYEQTMRSYYPYLPRFPHRLNAWKRQDGPVELNHSGGHRVRFPGLRMAPQSMYMRHYLFLSVPHAARKFGPQRYDRDEVAFGWHGWRARLTPAMIELPSEHDLRTYEADHLLDPSEPRKQHLAEEWAPQPKGPRALLRRATNALATRRG
jgi:glycosyltransferase involved in cell wall biosynthesis